MKGIPRRGNQTTNISFPRIKQTGLQENSRPRFDGQRGKQKQSPSRLLESHRLFRQTYGPFARDYPFRRESNCFPKTRGCRGRWPVLLPLPLPRNKHPRLLAGSCRQNKPNSSRSCFHKPARTPCFYFIPYSSFSVIFAFFDVARAILFRLVRA